MELRVLRYFLTVAREENITRAAELLHVSQPAVSRQLAQLEDELGVKLFVRSNHHITLTEDGLMLRRRAQEIVELAEKTQRDFRQHTAELTGEIAIGSGELRSFSMLGAVLADFSMQHPQVRYRLPTEAEWEYACRAGTVTPFNTETSISVDEANYWGHYPYQIEENYFTQENLETKPGIYREETVVVGSFAPNCWGLYDMHGNVSEWVWDGYSAYEAAAAENPTGAAEASQRVYRGGAWNDFAKNLRSAYRAAMQPELAAFNIGMRLVRNAQPGEGTVTMYAPIEATSQSNVLIAYFSWGGNTRGIAEEIQRQTGFDLFEIVCETPYSDDYYTVLEQAQADQNIQARPALKTHVENMEQYTVFNRDTKTFSGIWTAYQPDYPSFLHGYEEDAGKYSFTTQYEPKPGRPANSFDVSMVPWFSFTAFNLNVFGDGTYLLPIFTMGKTFEENEKTMLPLAIQVHHAVCDGYHVGKFIETLQANINKFDA